MTGEPHSSDGVMEHPPLAIELGLERLQLQELLRVAMLAATLAVLRLLHTPHLWHERSRQRAALAALDDRLLRDIGVSATGRRAECRKWFWQA